MKWFFSIIWLLLLNSSVFCQQASFKTQTSNLLVNNKWDLSKFVWSQTHQPSRVVDKPSFDYSVIDNWVHLDNSKLSMSPDGSYFTYKTYKGSSLYQRAETLYVRSTTGDWQKSFSSKSSGFFSADNKQFIFKEKESLNFLQLGSDQVRSVKQVVSYKLSTKDGTEWMAYQIKNEEADLVLQNLLSNKEKKIGQVAGYDFDPSAKWLACQLKSDRKELLLYNLESENERRIPFVESYAFSNNGKALVLKTIVDNKIELKYLELPKGEANTIWSTTGKDISLNNFNLDGNGRQIIFTLKNNSGNASDNSIWYYQVGMEKAVMKVNNQAEGIEGRFSIKGFASFTEDNHYIQFELVKDNNISVPASDAIMVDVWNHKDNILQSTQFVSKNAAKSYRAIINTGLGGTIWLEKENEKFSLLKGDFAIIKKEGQNETDRFWETTYKQDSVWLVFLKNGTRQLLPISRALATSICFSPQGQYLLYLDCNNGCHYFSVNLATGEKNKISTGIPDWKLGHEQRFNRPVEKPSMGCGIVGWLNGDKAVLVYDDYDIWQLDLTGKKAPISITNAYGRSHNVSFSLIDNDRQRNTNLVFRENDTLLLIAFNKTNKYSGFYRKALGVQGEPVLLQMAPFFYFRLHWATDVDSHLGMKPIHASRANLWIVQRESATEAPNYFLTNDFKTFKPLTQFHFDKNYNWLTSELHSFKQLDGTISQGILYKPENFDPSKKYPVIISFYSQLSGSLHQFVEPLYIECAELIRNQAWMVSHGYLVFFPDIYFTKGKWGPSVKNTVVGAANFLSQLPYVDSKSVGACGHSNGGRMGYYLFTHSNCFAAMSVSSGTTDIISNGLRMDEDGKSSLSWAEEGFPNGGIGNLWKDKATWIDHTSVLHSDKATCPLLIFQNKQDPSYFQAFELFTSLRRLGKVAWWLQYDKGDHRINSLAENPNELKDYTIRYTQYWDHFLKRSPAPRWMTQGIPAALKGFESGYELDPSGTCSLKNNCPICKGWNKKYKKNPELFTKPTSEWCLNP